MKTKILPNQVFQREQRLYILEETLFFFILLDYYTKESAVHEGLRRGGIGVGCTEFVGYIITHNSLVLGKTLFYSLPVLQSVLFSFFSQKKKKPIPQSLVSPITIFTNHMILAVSYEKYHTVRTLLFKGC